MTTYESAPATKLLATQCALCGRPLVDAVSVERGIGPHCAAKYGYGVAQAPADWHAADRALRLGGDADVSEELAETLGDGDPTEDRARVWANRLVYRCAALQSGPEVVANVRAIDALGFRLLARNLAERLGAIVVEKTPEGCYFVRAPYSEAFVVEARRVPGSRFDKEKGGRYVPLSSRVELWTAIRKAFGPGTLVAGERVGYIAA